MLLLSRLALIAAGLALFGCDQEPKEVSIIQQYSDIQSEWQDMALVYGFAFDNEELAGIARDAFAASFPERQYRVLIRQIPEWNYKQMRSHIAAP